MSPADRYQRTQALFQQASELPADDRPQFLERSCPDDPKLVQQVLDLLTMDEAERHTQTAQRSVGMPESWSWLASDIADEEAPERDSPPVRIGAYEVVREIGRGGMGVVYEAEQADPRRRVALKVMHPGYVSRDAIRRFRQEIRVLATLHHPGIAQVYDAGSHEGRPFFAMELVRGRSLLEHCRQNALGVRERLELIAKVCDAVTHAHQRGVVHRDLKPSNVLVSSSDDAPSRAETAQPKVLDFGVARLGEQDLSASLRTEVGIIIGTVPYMSPEQAAGSEAIDTRVDVYALGVMAYELLSGRPPFDTDGKSVVAACRMIQEEEPVPLSRSRPELRGDVETLVHHAMEKSVDRRYQSAAEFGADIRRYLASEPILAHPPSTLYRARKFAQRHRALVGAGIAVLVLLVAGTAISAAFGVRATRAERLATRENYRLAIAAASMARDNDQTRAAREWIAKAPAEYRGWEYRHLSRRLDQSAGTFAVPAGKHFFEAQPDGSLIGVTTEPGSQPLRMPATPGDIERLDGRLWLWHAARIEGMRLQIPSFDGHVWEPSSIASAPREHVPRGWPLRADERCVACVISRDGTALAALSVSQEQLRLTQMDLSTDECTSVLVPHELPSAHLGISPDGSLVAVCSGKAWIYERRSLQQRCILHVPGARQALHAVFSQDNQRVAVGRFNGGVELWSLDSASPTLLGQSQAGTDTALNLRFSPDGTLLACGGADGLIRLWDSRTLQTRSVLSGHLAEIVSITFVPWRGGLLASADSGGTGLLWALDGSGDNPRVLREHRGATQVAAVAPGRGLLVSGGWDKCVKLWNVETGAYLSTLETAGEVVGAAFSPDESRLVVLDVTSEYRSFDVSTGALIGVFRAPPGTAPASPGFHADGNRVLIDWRPGEPVRFWDMARNALVEDTPTSLLQVRSLDVSPSHGVYFRHYFIPEKKQITAQLWSIAEQRVLADFGGVPAPVIVRGAFTPDGSKLAVALPDNLVGIVDVRTGERIATLRGHNRAVLAMAYSPDGTRLFTSDYSRTIHVWETTSYEEMLQLRGHEASVRGLCVAPNGTLISTSGDFTTRLWLAPRDAR